jgi:allantoin racemase
MKIWYQSGLSFERFGAYETYLREHVRAATPEGGVDVYVNGTTRGGTGVEYRFTEYFFAREMIENALRAEREGFDAYVIGTTNDAGLFPSREVLNIPVIGITEASMHVACLMGRRFALITPNEKMIPHFEELAVRYGLRDRLAAIEYTEFKIPELGKVFEDAGVQHRQITQFKQGAQKVIAKGAEVIIPIGGIAGLFLARAGLRDIDGVPVIDTISVALKVAEMMTNLKRITGTFVSRRLSFARPPDEVLRQVSEDYGVGPHVDKEGTSGEKWTSGR